jgi:hypothetical protein
MRDLYPPRGFPEIQHDPPNRVWVGADNTSFVGAPVAVAVTATVAVPRAIRPLAEFTFALGANGEIVVADRYGAAWGEGASPSEAMEAWRAYAADVYRMLLEHKGRVHGSMQPQLEFLRRYFG